MPSRSWFLFLVAIGCAWAIGFFMGSPGAGGLQNAGAVPGENRYGAGGVNEATRTVGAPGADGDSKSVYSFAERMRGISSHPSARWRNAQFTRLAEEVAIADIPRLVEELKLSSSTENTEMTRMLFARWGEVDPRGALEFARRSKNGSGEHAALQEWAATDPTAAVAWVKALPAGPDRDMLVPSVIPVLARIDPAGAFQLLKENPGEKSGGAHLPDLIIRWTSKDLSAARAAVESLGPGYSRNSAMAALASGWAKLDPKAALDWALKLPDQHARRWAIESAIRSSETLDIEAIAARAKALPDERDQSALLAGLVGVTAKRDPEKAMSLLGEITATEMREGATISVIYAMMSTDVEKAATLAETLGNRGNDQPVALVAERLKFVDPARAATLCLKATMDSTNPIRDVLSTWLRNSPEAAVGWMENTKLPRNAAWIAQDSVARWAGENVSAATAFVVDRSASENLKWAVNGAIQGIASKDPKAAAEIAVGKAAAIVDASVFGAIGSNWAKKDPKAGSAWVLNLPDTQSYEAAATGFTRAWATAEPSAAAAWIDQLQPGIRRDAATSVFSEITAKKDPEAALQWAVTIRQEGTRYDAMNKVLRTWAEREPAAVKAWVASQRNLPGAVLSNLPE